VQMIADGDNLYTSVDEKVQSLLQDVQIYYYPVKHCTQSTERCVQAISNCAENRKAENDATAIFTWETQCKIRVNQKVKELNMTRSKKGNRHMSGGNGPERNLISNNAKKAQANREEAGTDMVSVMKPCAFKNKIMIEECIATCPSEEDGRKAKRVMKERANVKSSAKKLRKDQRDERIATARESKKYDASTINTAHLEVQARYRNTIDIKKFTKTATLIYLRKELLIRGVSEIEVKKLKSNSNMKVRLAELELKERGVEDSVIKAADQNWKTLAALLDKNKELKTEITLKHPDNVKDGVTEEIIRLSERKSRV